MRSRLIMLASTLAFTLFAMTSQATVPAQIGIQGRLTDALGSPFPEGGKQFKFAIFDSDFGGTQIWPGGGIPEQEIVTTDGEGLWSHQLGSVIPIGYTVFTTGYVWLEIRVDVGDGQEVVLPRTRIVSGAYAQQVASVDGAWGGVLKSKLTVGLSNNNMGTDAFLVGDSNTALAAYASVVGGRNNSAGVLSTIGGGTGNYVLNSSFIGGGTSNYAVGDNCVIGGGSSNQALGAKSNVSAGSNNIAGSDHAFVGGGADNDASGAFSFIGAGDLNVATGDYATIAGGTNNHASGTFSFVGGGGSTNPVDSNAASGSRSSVVGGGRNWATGQMSAIGGGYRNTASGDRSAIGGGDGNIASGFVSVVGGGNVNTVSGSYSTIGGGESNLITGFRSTIPGGSFNSAIGHESFAAGVAAKANHRSSFVWNGTSDPADSFATTGLNQFLIKATGGVGIGTNTPRAPLHVKEGSAGSVTAADAAAVVIERNNSAYIHILTPDDFPQGIIFGTPANSQMGGIWFNSIGGGFAKGLGFFTGNNNLRMKLDSLGNLTVVGCVSASNLVCPSDGRFKRDIQTLSEPLEKVARLRGVRYAWNTDDFAEREFPKGEQIGLVAQEVQKVVPQAVTEMSDGYLAVDYSRLVPLLIEGMKEQQKRIEALEKKLDRQTP